MKPSPSSTKEDLSQTWWFSKPSMEPLIKLALLLLQLGGIVC